ncbi:Alpha/Beta hydrolase protein [Mycena rosella]|uniref:Alpha/Beta hydrolase protein n=1 Tax=Mycena rosella TaxID=1033263 RepID=A0AAD7DGE4_MYCRO|nr:Alpha/Beta hydrolase protein [Mycena rosella]
MNREAEPYGTWKSPLTLETITDTANCPDLVDVLVDPIASIVYHIEKRPAEGGRNALLRTETGQDVAGGDWDIKTTVNGYGGAPAIVHDGIVYFSHGKDGRVYRVSVDGPNNVPEAITPENSSHKFANFDVCPTDPTLLICVFEDHTGAVSSSDVVNSLAVLNVSTKTVSPLHHDASFYSSPKFSLDGKHLVWVEWDLPDMPWIGTEIWVADVLATPGPPHSLLLQNPRHVAGEHGKISVAYPTWVSNNLVLFTSDISGFPNPWIYDCSAGEAKPVFEIPMAESFGYGTPPKRLGWSPYAVANAQGTTTVFTAIKDGRSVLYIVDLTTGVADLLPSPYVEIEHLRPLHPDQNQIVFLGKKADAPPAILGTQPVHIIYYVPTNPKYAGLDGEKPPCVLNAHGGPVGFSAQSLDTTKQFFTTRGWAWLDVNYGGSSGYGRVYMERLREKWGVVDVDDCIDAALILSSAPHNLIDPKRIVIRGSSGGGFTTLSALSARADARVFAAGASLYGISDLQRLTRDTHKFESGYLTMLIGADPQVLLDRSPISHADKIMAPLLILQGDSDTAVPPSQAEVMVDSIRTRGGVVEYKLYAGEGHGWKRRDTIQDALKRELQFYKRVLGIEDTEFEVSEDE